MKSGTQVLIGQRRAAIDEAKALRDKATAEHRDLTDAELREIDIHLGAAEKLAARIAAGDDDSGDLSPLDRRIENAIAWGNEIPPGQRVRQTNPAHGNGPGSVDWGGSHTTPTRPTGRGRSYNALFGAPASNGGFSTFGDWLKTLASGLHHPGMVPVAGMVGSEGAAGGFLVPEMFAAAMLDKAVEQTIIVQRADVRAMTFPTLKVAGLDDSSHSSHLFGGLTGDWISEGGDITNTEPKVRKIELTAKKLACLSKSSNELAEDAPDFERLLGDALVAGLSWYLDLACLAGTGAGQPLGILNDPALIEVAAETSPAQAAATIVYENLTKMLARLHPACLSNAIWVANPTCIPQLLGLTVRVQNSAGTDYVGGSHVPVLSQTGGAIRHVDPPRFLRREVACVGHGGRHPPRGPVPICAGAPQAGVRREESALVFCVGRGRLPGDPAR